MLFLVFQIGDTGYALAAGEVVEILPMLPLRTLRGAPVGMAGSFAYRGDFLPAVDLCAIELGRPAADRMSTRILVVRGHDRRGEARPFGLIVENATDILRCEPDAFTPFAQGPRGLVQRIAIDALVPATLSAGLFDAMAVA